MSDQTRDPWKNMTRYVPRHGDQCVSSDDGLLVLVEDVDVARAADAQTIATLQDENARLKADIACMVEKAASKSLEGYRELGRQTVEALRQHDDARAELVTLKAAAARREREALSHEDACVLSRIFNQYQLIQIDQYERINEFLKSLIESAFLTQRQEQSKP